MAKNKKSTVKNSKDTGAVKNELEGITNVLIVIDKDTLQIHPEMIVIKDDVTLEVFGRPVKKLNWFKRSIASMKRWFNK